MSVKRAGRKPPLVIASLLAAVLCLAHGKVFADTAAGGSGEAREWEAIDRFDVDAVREFLARHPDSPLREQIEHRLLLLEKMEAIESGKRSAVTIAFSTLAPWLGTRFEEHGPDSEKTVCRYFAWRSEGLMGKSSGTMLGEPRCLSHEREDGSIWPVMGRGTIVAIRTNEIEYRWLEGGGAFVSDHQSTLVFGVLPKMGGLVLLEGRGRFIALDGTQIELSEE